MRKVITGFAVAALLLAGLSGHFVPKWQPNAALAQAAPTCVLAGYLQSKGGTRITQNYACASPLPSASPCALSGYQQQAGAVNQIYSCVAGPVSVPQPVSSAGATQSTFRCVADTFTASGTSQAVTYKTAFANQTASISIVNSTAGTELASTVLSSVAATGFSATVINTDVYYYMACGF